MSDSSPPRDPVESTRRLVRIPSVNPSLEDSGSGEEAVARRCAEWLEGWGWSVRVEEIAPGRHNVSAVRGEAGPSLLLNGHLDTVGVAGMTVDPFGGDSDDERIVGRGSCDMKAGVAIVLDTARRAAAEGWPGRLHVLLTADEEHASLGMAAAVREGLEAEAAVVTEPTSLAVMPAHKGFAWVRGMVRGRAAHGSRPEVGVDAVRDAARILAGLDALDRELRARPAHPLLGHGSWHVGTIRGGAAPSVYPDRCEVVLERRTLPAEDGEGFVEELRRHLPDDPGLRSRVSLETEMVRPGSDVDAGHPLVAGLVEAARAEGSHGRIEGMTAWVDAAFLNEAGIPAVCFGPGSIEKAHTADEFVPVAEIEAGARILARFARRWLSR